MGDDRMIGSGLINMIRENARKGKSAYAVGKELGTLHISDTYGHCFRKHPDSDFGIIRTLISAHPDTLSKD